MCYSGMVISCESSILEGTSTWILAGSPEQCVDLCNASDSCESFVYETDTAPTGTDCAIFNFVADVTILGSDFVNWYALVKLQPVCTV
jgi:hypothetical protein